MEAPELTRISSGAFDRSSAARGTLSALAAAPSPPSLEGVRADFMQSPRHSASSMLERVRTTEQGPIESG